MRMELRGADELSNALLELPRGLRNSTLRKAVNKAARIMVPPLRRATPRSKKGTKSPKATPPGTLRKSTGIILRKYRGGMIQAAYIGHRWPKGAAAHLRERGTKARKTKRGANRGAVAPKPFFKPVYDSSKHRVQRTMREQLTKGIAEAREKAARKALKKAVG